MAEILEVLSVKHWIETPVRFGDEFAKKDLKDCKLSHKLFALPGPSNSKKTLTDGHVAQATLITEGACEHEGKSGFQILLDVVQFCPEDIILQTFEGWLLIKAQHGPRMDEHGFVSRTFTRQYKLPQGVQADDLTAFLCHDGILVVEMKKNTSND
ncbi:heat shock protein beta-3 [Protopterus annectens]|uniref:heat shock protein beta-3 n=1 Tax=Protopterus annectens TaxID=7888 RepID=UPI001CFAD0EA|nr:heat shock protein beta-3 [Protopterus annectens]